MWTITGEGDCLHSGVSGPGATLMWSSALGFSMEFGWRETTDMPVTFWRSAVPDESLTQP
uniref:Uncharacterized protein n=1 Tax=Anguilla anguilla TaxID=7936 RepID=A0A0E9SD21_ANGAN